MVKVGGERELSVFLQKLLCAGNKERDFNFLKVGLINYLRLRLKLKGLISLDSSSKFGKVAALSEKVARERRGEGQS